MVLLKYPKTKEPNMVPVISRSQKRKIQRRYTQYQKDLKKSGKRSSLVQSKGQIEEKKIQNWLLRTKEMSAESSWLRFTLN